MKTYSLAHLTDSDLTSGLFNSIARDRASTVHVLVHIAEFDKRKLFRPAAFPSMIVYCERKLHLPRGAAFKRITVARKAREVPELFVAVEDGRLNLSTALLLVPHLTRKNCAELLGIAA